MDKSELIMYANKKFDSIELTINKEIESDELINVSLLLLQKTFQILGINMENETVLNLFFEDLKDEYKERILNGEITIK